MTAPATIPYGRQSISEEDIEAVVQVLRSDWLTQGPVVPAFESAMANACDAVHAVAVSNATSALHIACLALDVGPGDRVWTTPISFVASANCALYCGAEVDFVDIDPRTYNMSTESLAQKLKQAKAVGQLPKVVIPVHLCGQPCDMAAIAQLAREYGFGVIEDASHAVGAHYQGEPVGNGRYSDITVFSFHPVKIITSAEGGMALTNNDHLARRMVHLRSHGITRDGAQMTEPSHGPWYYQQTDLGFNYRMTELQAALGLSQLERLGAFVARRQMLAARYDQKLADLPLTLPWQHPDTQSSRHLYVIRLQPQAKGPGHKQVFEALRAQGIGVNLHYIPIHIQPYHRARLKQVPQLPEAERYYAEAISLPLYADLSLADQDRVIAGLGEILETRALTA